MRALDDPFTAEMERLGPPILDYSVYRDDDRAGSQAQPAISAAQPIQRLAPISPSAKPRLRLRSPMRRPRVAAS
jgi:hypothetical protein